MSKMYVSFGDNKLTNDRLVRIYSIVEGLDVEVSLLPHVGVVRIEGRDEAIDQLCALGGPFENKSWADPNVFVVVHSPASIEGKSENVVLAALVRGLEPTVRIMTQRRLTNCLSEESNRSIHHIHS